MRKKSISTRLQYEKLLTQIAKETGILFSKDVNSLSDYQLMAEINKRLIKADCVPLTQEELEMELS